MKIRKVIIYRSLTEQEGWSLPDEAGQVGVQHGEEVEQQEVLVTRGQARLGAQVSAQQLENS